MKIMRILLPVLLLALTQATAYATPDASIHGEMGNAFQTVMIKTNTETTEPVYYMAILQGGKPLSHKEIIAMEDINTLPGLINGSIVRGKLTPNPSGEHVLRGMENLEPIAGETGFIGGMWYDIYLSTGEVAIDIMAQPFESMGQMGEYVICTAEQLANIQRLAQLYKDTDGKQGSLDFMQCPNKLYVLGADIDLPPGWVPIGSTEEDFAFKGNFDGGGHKIRNLQIENKPWSTQGLFGKIEEAYIYNLVLVDACIKLGDNSPAGGNKMAVGLLAGEAKNSRIKNITIENGKIASINGSTDLTNGSTSQARARNNSKSVTGGSILHIGGLVGRLRSCIVENALVSVEIDAAAATAGGVVGLSVDTKIYNSGTEGGAITGNSIAGGFAGRLEGTGLIAGCYSNVDVTGGIAGGFAGQVNGSPLTNNANHGLEISHSRATGKTTAMDSIAGGFIGEGAYVFIKDCAAFGDVYGHTVTGGFVGLLSDLSRIIHSYAKGDARMKTNWDAREEAMSYTKEDTTSVASPKKNSKAIENPRAPGGAIESPKAIGGFVGKVSGGACIEFSYSVGSVVSDDSAISVNGAISTGAAMSDDAAISVTSATPIASGVAAASSDMLSVGGFAGIISAKGPPNTLTHCLSFAPWVVAPQNSYVHRFAGNVQHDGVNGCYAYLGSMVVQGGTMAHVLPNAYGPDGADMSHSQVDRIRERLGWKRPILLNQ